MIEKLLNRRKMIGFVFYLLLMSFWAFNGAPEAKGRSIIKPYGLDLCVYGGKYEYVISKFDKKHIKIAERIISNKDDHSITFLVKGGEKTVRRFRKKISKSNGYGVLFNYSVIKKTKNYTWVRISGKDRKLYRTSIKLIKKIRRYYLKYYPYGYYFNQKFKESEYLPRYTYHKDDAGNYRFYKDGKEYLTFLYQNDGTYLCWDSYLQEYETAYFEDIELEIEEISDEYISPTQKKEYSFYKKIKNTRFADLSSAVKVRVLSTAFWCDTSKKKKGNPFIRYRYSTLSPWNKYVKYNKSGSDLSLLNRLVKGSAIAVCEGYSRYEKALYKQIGLKTYYASIRNHAIRIVKTKNSKGKTLWMYENYDKLVSSKGKIRVVGGSTKACKYVIKCSASLKRKIHKNRWSKKDVK